MGGVCGLLKTLFNFFFDKLCFICTTKNVQVIIIDMELAFNEIFLLFIFQQYIMINVIIIMSLRQVIFYMI